MAESTVESWCRKNSSGPGDIGTRAEIERIFNATFDENNKQKFSETIFREEEKIMKYSDFVKVKILEDFELIHNFITKNIEDEDEFCKIREKIEINALVIPDYITNLLDDFIEDELEPIIYHEPGNRLEELEKFRTINDGVICIKEGMEVDGVASYYKLINSIESKLFVMAKEYFHPILCN